MKKIVVIKTKFIGDTVLSSVFFQTLKLLHSNAHVTAVVSPLTFQVLEHDPYIDAFIVTDALDSHSKKNKRQRLTASIELVSTLKAGQFECAYVLTRSFYSALLVKLSGITTRVGLNTEGRGFLLTHSVVPTFNIPEYQIYLKLLGGVSEGMHKSSEVINQIKPKYFMLEGEQARALKWLSSQGLNPSKRPMVFLHLSGSSTLRRWVTSAWTEVSDTLAGMGFTIIWSGAASDMVQMQSILNQMQSTTRQSSCVLPVLSGGGLLPLREVAAIISHCKATIAVDTGLMHLSAAIAVPTIGLFGPGDTAQWGPTGPLIDLNGKLTQPYFALVSDEQLPCRPCHGRRGCLSIQSDTQLPQCMQGLKPEKVVNVFKSMVV